MIRINLLPRKRRAEQQSTAGQGWLIAIMLALLAQAAGFFAWHQVKSGELESQTRKNAELSAQIEQSKRAVANHAEVKAKLADLRAKEEAIAALQSARTGPTAVLLELARLLTAGRGPTVDPARLELLKRENPLAVFSPNWDSRRLWLTRFIEKDRSVQIGGLARDGEDVSEFARRLGLSSYFEGIRLLPGKRASTGKSNLEVVEFELQAKARY
ncbi:MAG TPA: PilN domain-containing protein [Polyangiaceae bacterium]